MFDFFSDWNLITCFYGLLALFLALFLIADFIEDFIDFG